jgi:hypothetical protein
MSFTVGDARGYIADALAVRDDHAAVAARVHGPQLARRPRVRISRVRLPHPSARYCEALPREAAKPRSTLPYLEVDGWEYWTMGAPIAETTVINRSRTTGAEIT